MNGIPFFCSAVIFTKGIPLLQRERMRMKKKWISLLLVAVLCLMLLPASAGGDWVAFRVNGETVSVLTAGEITLPEAPALAKDTVFIGWSFSKDGETVLLPAGATCTVEGETYIDAVTVCSYTLGAASVYASGEEVGLRFSSQINKADYAVLLALLGEDGFTLGTLIATKDLTAKIGGRLTAELLDAKGYAYIEVETNKVYKTTAAYEEWAGSVASLKMENMSRTYAAIGYIVVRYHNGEEARVYLKAAEANKNGETAYRQFASAEVYTAFLNAYDDRNAGYKNVVWEGDIITYSPYTQAQLQKIRQYLDAAVCIRVPTSGNLYVEQKGYYESPYQISYDGNKNKGKVTITAKDGSTLEGRLVAIACAGSYRSLADLTKTSNFEWSFDPRVQTPDF